MANAQDFTNMFQAAPIAIDSEVVTNAFNDLARAFMSQANSLGVKRMEPVWTDRGKLMPLHMAKKSPAASNPAESQE